jgi:hypothetical protein
MNKKLYAVIVGFYSIQALQFLGAVWKCAYPSQKFTLSTGPLASLKCEAAQGRQKSQKALAEFRKLYTIKDYRISNPSILYDLYSRHLIEKTGRLPQAIEQAIYPLL